MFFVVTLIIGGWGVVRWGRKSYLGSTEIASFSCRDFSRRNNKIRHVVPTSYFYFWWTIAISDFRPFKIYKNLSVSLSTNTFTVYSHGDDHCYKYIYLFQILHSMKNFLKYMLRFFIFIRKMIYSKNSCTHMRSHANWVNEKVDVMISVKDQ